MMSNSVIVEIGDTGEFGADGADEELLDIIALLEDCGARIHRQREGDWNRMTIEIPLAGKRSVEK